MGDDAVGFFYRQESPGFSFKICDRRSEISAKLGPAPAVNAAPGAPGYRASSDFITRVFQRRVNQQFP